MNAQKVLGDITSGASWDVYMPDEEIDPDVEVAEDESAAVDQRTSGTQSE